MELVYHNESYENGIQQIIEFDGNVRNVDSLRKVDAKYGSNTQDYELKFLKDMKAKLQVRLTKAEEIVQKLEDKLKKKEVEHSNTNKQLENVKRDFSKAKSHLETSEEEVAALKKKIEKLELENKLLFEDLKKEEEKVKELEEFTKKELLKNKSALDDVNKKNTLIRQLENYNESLYERNQSLESKNEQLRVKVEEMMNDNDDKEMLRNRINELKAENNNLRMEMTEIHITKTLTISKPRITPQRGSIYEELSSIPGEIQKEMSTQTSGLNGILDLALHDTNLSIDSQDFVDGINGDMNSTRNSRKKIISHFSRAFRYAFKFVSFLLLILSALFWAMTPFLCTNFNLDDESTFFRILKSFFEVKYYNLGPRPS